MEAEEADIKPNFRLAEPNIYYNAEKEIGEWWKKSYSISSWDKAVVVGKDYWGKLVERGIPQWKNFGLIEYENATVWYGKSLEEDYTIELKLPYNMQFTPYFDIEVPRGKRIDIYTDTYDTIFPDQKNIFLISCMKRVGELFTLPCVIPSWIVRTESACNGGVMSIWKCR